LAEGAVSESDPRRVHAFALIDELELKSWMCRVGFEQRVSSPRTESNIFGQRRIERAETA